MNYKKIFLFVNIFFGGGSLIFLTIGTTLALFSIVLIIIFLVLSFIFFIIFIIPEFLNIAKVFAISRYGSHEDNDLLSHFADMYFNKIFAGRISTQVDITNEEQMTVFADGLINMYRSDVLPEAKMFYPELPESYWVSLFNSLENVEKDVMLQVFFPEIYGGLEPINPTQKFLDKFPFMNKNTLHNLIKWWKRFKLKMEWQDRVDGIQR